MKPKTIKLKINGSTQILARETVLKKLKDMERKDYCEFPNCRNTKETEGGNLDVHHTYMAIGLEDELNYTGFITLCRECHNKTMDRYNHPLKEKYREICKKLVQSQGYYPYGWSVLKKMIEEKLSKIGVE